MRAVRGRGFRPESHNECTRAREPRRLKAMRLPSSSCRKKPTGCNRWAYSLTSQWSPYALGLTGSALACTLRPSAAASS